MGPSQGKTWQGPEPYMQNGAHRHPGRTGAVTTAGRRPRGRFDRAERWLTVREAGDLLGISTSTVRRWAAQGLLTEVRTPGGHRRIAYADVLAAQEAQSTARAEVLPLDAPDEPLPSFAALMRERGAEVAERAIRMLYRETADGWFATSGAQPHLKRWLEALAAGGLTGDHANADLRWLELARTARSAGASYLEVLRFQERFAQSVLTVSRGSSETLAVRRLLTHQVHLLAQEADRGRGQPAAPDRLLAWVLDATTHMSAAMFYEDPEGRILVANQAAQDLLGLDEDALVDRPFLSLVPPDRLAEAAEAQERLLAGETPQRFAMTSASGEVRTFLMHGLPLPGLPGLAKVGREVTAEQVIERDAWLYAAIVQGSSDAILSAVGGLIRSWNPGAERLYGYTAEEAIGQPLTLFTPGDHAAQARATHAAAMTGKVIRDLRVLRLTKAGELIEVVLTVAPVRNAEGTIIGTWSMSRAAEPSERP